MIGCYDFCGHYDWTFEWLRRAGGEGLVSQYWEEAIGSDSQKHARDLIVPEGFEGMKKYWAHTLEEEAAGYNVSEGEGVMRIDIHACPSKGFLLRNALEHYRDYCDHCIGWIGPVMKDAGFVIHHEHNHRGLCWWEMRPREDCPPPSGPGELAGGNDVRLADTWPQPESPRDVFFAANSSHQKQLETGG